MLAQAMADTVEAYRARTPGSADHFARACQSLAAGNTRNNLFYAPYPLRFVSAQGSQLQDVDGATYVDLLNDFTVSLAGHSHPDLIRAARMQLDKGMSFGGTTEAEYLLAEQLKLRFPAIDLVRFVNSGTEANLYAFLLSLTYTGRRKIVVFDGGYHGGTMNYAHAGSSLNIGFDLIRLPYNDVGALEAVMAAQGGEIAAIALELMLNAGGCIPASPAFAAAAARLSRASGSLLLVDEVMSARLGYGGLQAHYGLSGDIVTLGKFIGGGFSIGALGGRAEIMERFDSRVAGAVPHGGSFNNNVMSMNAGLAALTDVHTASALAGLNASGDRLRERLNAIFRDEAMPLCVTGLGSVMNLHLGRTPPVDATKPVAQKPLCDLFHMTCLLAGYWIAPRGLVALSLANGEVEIDGFVNTVRDFIHAYGHIVEELA